MAIREPRLGLGTVQFGMNYGIANTRGQPTAEEVKGILRAASYNGIRLLDTAASYGDAEEAIGNSGEAGRFAIITKTLPLRLCGQDREPLEAVREAFSKSLRRLRVGSVDTVLVHDANDLLGPCGQEIYGQLQEYCRQGLVRRVGVSAYTGDEVDALLDRFKLDVVQVAANVFDQRLSRRGQLQRLTRFGVEIHVRSAFLQGLLLLEPAKLSARFAPLRSKLIAWRRRLDKDGLTPAQGALAYLRSLNVDVVLVGVDSIEQLVANLRDFSTPLPQRIDFSEFAVEDESFVNPSRWKH
jgi:aryl-alcohol dehydrogenase-like predicted oxidoreductase